MTPRVSREQRRASWRSGVGHALRRGGISPPGGTTLIGLRCLRIYGTYHWLRPVFRGTDGTKDTNISRSLRKTAIFA
jgi:hypothetical protein